MSRASTSAATALNREFARLAAARKIMAVRGSTGSVAADRANAERWIARFGRRAGDTDDASMERREHSVVVRPAHAETGAPHVLYIHGGGLVYYSTEVFRPFLRVLADAVPCTVEAFDYLKAPEHSVEQSVEQLAAHVAARCAQLRGQPLVLAGDSVGGLLALYVAARVVPDAFSRAVLIYPVLDLGAERHSYAEFGTGYFLDRAAMRRFTAILAPYFTRRDFAPFALSESDLAALPPLTVVTAGCDILRDEGFAWLTHLEGRGVTVRHQHFPDLPHDFCLYADTLDSAHRAVAEIAACITLEE